MKKRLFPAVAVFLGLALFSYSALTQGYTTEASQQGDKDDPKPPVLGDRDDILFQNLRFLTVKNDSASTLTVYFQYRTMAKGVFTWLPAVPKEDAEALSFEIKAGEEIKVKAGDDLVAASRVRLWATSENEKWLAYKTRDLWLVPEKNEEGDHVYPGEAPETFTFTFTPKKGDMDDPDLPIASTFPGQDPSTIVPDTFLDPGELIPGGGVMPVIHDLAVLPVSVSGANALIRVKNKGHASENLGQKLFVKKTTPGALATDLGPIGLLFHHQVRPFNVVGLAPGDYLAFISPGDDPPFDANDARPFTIGNTAFLDLRVLKVNVVGGKAKIRVKNVGSKDFAGGRKLKVIKLSLGAQAKNVGDIGALDVNKVQAFPDFPLAPGTYKAFISPGDAPPHHSNDHWTFTVAAPFADLKVLPVAVISGHVHVHVKNVGTEPAAAGKELMVVKLLGAPVSKGPIGMVLPGASKPFVFPLPPGKYKAFIKPGDPAPHDGNDFDNFIVAAPPFVDLMFLSITVQAANVHVKIKNIGTAPCPAGRHLKTHKTAALNNVDHGDIGALDPGKIKSMTFALPPGTYKATINPGDLPAHAGNDFENFTVAAPAVPDLAVGPPMKAANKVKATITNNGPGKYTPGTRQWHLEKLVVNNWMPVASGNVPALNAGANTMIQGNFTGPGTYRIRLTGSDGNSANDSKSKAL